MRHSDKGPSSGLWRMKLFREQNYYLSEENSMLGGKAKYRDTVKRTWRLSAEKLYFLKEGASGSKKTRRPY